MQFSRTNYSFLFNLFLWIFFLITTSVFAQVNCSHCDKPIFEEYIIVEDKTFHNDHFLCSICNKPIKAEYYRDGDDFLDSECYVKNVLPKCKQCNKPIEGEYLVQENKKYHEDCFINYQTDKCAICGKPIISEFQMDQFSNKYHTYHENTLIRCDNCFQIISKKMTNGGVKYSDGRNICNTCFGNAKKGPNEVKNIYKKVLSKLQKMGLNINDNNIEIFNSNRTNLKKIAGKRFSKNMQGYCKIKTETRTYGNNSSSVQYFKIYVLDGVPSEFLESVIAHELMHVWIYQNTIIDHTSKLIEGSCNYISYLYLKDRHGRLAKHALLNIESNSDKIYGDGFRSVYKKFGNKRLNALLKYLELYSEL